MLDWLKEDGKYFLLAYVAGLFIMMQAENSDAVLWPVLRLLCWIAGVPLAMLYGVRMERRRDSRQI